MRVKYKGQPIKNWEQFFDQIQVPDSLRSYSNSVMNRKVIKSAQKLTSLEIKTPQMALLIYPHSKNLSIEICYRSVFKDYWVVSCKGLIGGEESTYQQVDSCSFHRQERFWD